MVYTQGQLPGQAQIQAQSSPAKTRLTRSTPLRQLGRSQPSLHQQPSVVPTRHRPQVSEPERTDVGIRQENVAPGMLSGRPPVTRKVAMLPEKRQVSSPGKTASPGKLTSPGKGSRSSSKAPQTPTHAAETRHPNLTALQIELLQLHLFHTAAVARERELHTDAQEKLNMKRRALSARAEAVVERQKGVQRYLNVTAVTQLIDSSEQEGKPDFMTQMQTLLHVVRDVAELTDRAGNGGRYMRCIEEFERWSARVPIRLAGDKVREHRQQPDLDIDFVDPLPLSWRTEVLTLITKLDLAAHELDLITVHSDTEANANQNTNLNMNTHAHVDTQSALFRIVTAHRRLVASMRAELATVAALERKAVGWQHSWVRSDADRMLLEEKEKKENGGESEEKGEEYVPIWKQQTINVRGS